MLIRVLGKSPAWQDAGGACSGYLITDGTTTLLLDCGNGVFAKLRTAIDYADVDAVVVTHMHADHFLDLVPYSYALTYSPRTQTVPVDHEPEAHKLARPRLLVPPGGRALLRAVSGCWGHDDLIVDAFDCSEYEPPDELAVGTLHMRFQPVPHYVPTNAIQIRSSTGGGSFTFGADHRPTDALDAFARETDLIMLEATLAHPERAGQRGHLTPGEAGEHAAHCGAVRLVLTHISDELDADWACAQAGLTFAGPVEIAREGAVYDV